MTAEASDQRSLAGQLDAIAERLEKLEVRVRALVPSQIVAAKKFILRDERGEIRGRLKIADYSPCLTFYDCLGKVRLRVGPHRDGSPLL